jgi:hypothetical protein
LTRDCSDCGLPDGLKLQNFSRTNPTNLPLLYVCIKCGASLTVPPPAAPHPKP